MPLIEAPSRAPRPAGWLRDAAHDVRYAWRQFARDRRGVAIVVLTLGIGVGINTAIFSIVDGFRRPLPVPDPDRIVVVAAETKGDEQGAGFRHSLSALHDFRRAAAPFSDLFGFSLQWTGITANGRASSFIYAAVTGNYFTALGVKPLAGRFFLPGEGEQRGDDSLVVLGHSFWQRRLGGNPAVIGTSIMLGGRPARVIGIAPPEFHGTYAALNVDGYVPLNAVRWDEAGRAAIFDDRKARPLTVLGRLKPGATIADAQAAMTLAARRLEREYPESDQGIGVRVIAETRARPDPMGLVGGAGRSDRAGEVLLLVLAGLVLILACFNVANLLLVRSMARAREMAIRAALGSGRARLVRQVLTETLLLSAFGTAAGLVLGRAGSRMFERLIDLRSDVPVLLDFSFDWRVFAYATAAALVCACVIAILPAIRASRADAADALHSGGRSESGGRGRSRLRALLAGGQIAGSLVLLVVAALFVRDLRGASRMDFGFSPDEVLNVRMQPFWAGYDMARTNAFYRDVEARVRELPGVRSTAFAHSSPLGYYWQSATVDVEGRPVERDRQPPNIPINYVSPDYFTTMQMRITRGRAFTELDVTSGAGVAIVNETMAARYWPNQDPIGKRFRIRSSAEELQVIGVARNSRYINLFESPQPYVYLLLGQFFESMRVLHVRASVPPEQLAARVQATIAAVGPDVPVADVQTMRSSLYGFAGLMLLRLAAVQAAVLGVLGLVLAAIGVYGVASYATTQRTREIGIRMALGADSRRVLQLVLSQGTWMIVGGVAVGLVGAAAMAGAMSRLLRMQGAIDPIVFGGVTCGLAAIALAACYLPARRAMRVVPTVALREE